MAFSSQNIPATLSPPNTPDYGLDLADARYRLAVSRLDEADLIEECIELHQGIVNAIESPLWVFARAVKANPPELDNLENLPGLTVRQARDAAEQWMSLMVLAFQRCMNRTLQGQGD